MFISVVISFELKMMCSERSGRRLFGSVAVITDLWSLSNLIMTFGSFIAAAAAPTQARENDW